MGRAARRYGNAVSNTTRRPSPAAGPSAAAGQSAATSPAEAQAGTASSGPVPPAEQPDGTPTRLDRPPSDSSPPRRPVRRWFEGFARWWDTPGAFDTAV